MDYKELSMYNLFIDRKNHELKIKKVTNRRGHLLINYTDDVQYFNEYYFVCTDRAKLKEKAIEIKQSWIDELESDLEKTRAIKI